MSLDLTVVPHPAYLHVTLTGKMSLPATIKAIVAIIDAALDKKQSSILIDWRLVTGMHAVTTLDRFESASFLSGQVVRLRSDGLRDVRIANVSRDFTRDAEGFSVTVAANRGLSMTFLTTEAAALTWLGVQDQP